MDGSGQDWNFAGHVQWLWDGEDLSTLTTREQFNLEPVGN